MPLPPGCFEASARPDRGSFVPSAFTAGIYCPILIFCFCPRQKISKCIRAAYVFCHNAVYRYVVPVEPVTCSHTRVISYLWRLIQHPDQTGNVIFVYSSLHFPSPLEFCPDPVSIIPEQACMHVRLMTSRIISPSASISNEKALLHCPT